MMQGIDYIGVGVGAIIFRQDGNVFLAKRGRDVRNEMGKWEFPGGGIEFGETLQAALHREVMEEYGFEVEVLRLLDVVNHILPEERQHWVSPTFLCRFKQGTPEIREPHKCDSIGWFDVDQIPEHDLSRASQQSLKSLRDRMKECDVRGTLFDDPIRTERHPLSRECL